MVYVSIVDSVSDYKEAIALTCATLCRERIVTEAYYQGIMKNIDEHGGYFYLGEGVCMPHARAEEGVLSTGMCILKLNNVVDFKGNQVNLFFTLAAKNKNDHMGLLKKVATACAKSEVLWKIHTAESDNQILNLLGFEDEEKNYDSL